MGGARVCEAGVGKRVELEDEGVHGVRMREKDKMKEK